MLLKKLEKNIYFTPILNNYKRPFMKIKIYLIAIISIFLFSSCDVKEISVGNIEGISIVEMNKDYIDVDILIPIKNPNNFGFKVTKADINIEMNGVSLGKVSKFKKVKIPANSNDTHKFSVRVKMEDMKQGGLAFLGSLLSNKAGLNMKGYIKARSFLITKKIDVDYNKNVKLFKDLK